MFVAALVVEPLHCEDLLHAGAYCEWLTVSDVMIEVLGTVELKHVSKHHCLHGNGTLTAKRGISMW